jgi:hypothetical protein
MKIKTIILINFIGLNFSCNTLNNGLVAYYPFNGNANDESTYKNNGIVYGATLANDRSGNKDKAYYFDGIENYIAVQNSPSLNITGAISLCAWIKVEETCYSPGIINKINQDKSTGYLLRFNNYNDLLGEFRLYYSAAKGMSAKVNSKDILTDNLWHFLVGTYDGDSLCFYLDGKKVSSLAYKNGIGSNSNDLLIGYDTNTYLNSNKRFNGSIDDVRIYNRALKELEIIKLQNLK